MLRFVVTAAALALASIGPGWALVVAIDQPTFLEPALGVVAVEVSVESREPVVRVALWVDERPQAILETPPFRWLVDVGAESSAHTFRVVATTERGESAEAAVTTPPLATDEQVDLELQQLYVSVVRDGRPAADVARTAFIIEDQGERQELVTFERGDVPLTAVVLLDVSSSMGGRELGLALSSSRAFIEGLQALDRVRLLLFADRVIRATDFTGFPEVLFAALTGVEATGPTALQDHLYMAIKMLERRQGRRVVLLLSDGIDSASVLTADDVATYAERSQALVYWLRLPAPGPRISSAWHDAASYRRQVSRLEELVEDSGGRILELDGVEEAEAAFAEVLGELRNQYVLGYYPTTRMDDGSWHPVRVRASGPGLKVRARRGYFDY